MNKSDFNKVIIITSYEEVEFDIEGNFEKNSKDIDLNFSYDGDAVDWFIKAYREKTKLLKVQVKNGKEQYEFSVTKVILIVDNSVTLSRI